MQLKLENIQVGNCVSVLEKMPLKGMKSIHRTRLANQLKEKLDRIIKEEKEIRKDHSHLNEDDEPKIKENGTLDLKVDIEEFRKIMQEFYEDKIVIDGGDSQVALKSVKNSVEDCEVEWDGKEAVAFEHLYSGFEGEDSKDAKQDGGE
ncbi:hypothetical protein JOC34_000464 [Virgibacillus halotolerans]|uniref:DUF1617 family protein n=1 Tax=Virgibacillus halotolerans TaxID=1071053 RepID=UPI00195F63FD|nr:DUF1617 family protein [Virgibacillus halotolerans]MBM7598107.1 hypothetical protein [Virgibacillus halotolerans]